LPVSWSSLFQQHTTNPSNYTHTTMSHCPENLIEQAMQVLLETMDPEHEELYDKLSQYVSTKKTYVFTSVCGEDQCIDIDCKPVDVDGKVFQKYVLDTLEERIGHPSDCITIISNPEKVDAYYYTLHEPKRPKWKTYQVNAIISSCFSIPYNADYDDVDLDEDGNASTAEDFPIIHNWNQIDTARSHIEFDDDYDIKKIDYVCNEMIEDEVQNEDETNVQRYNNWDFTK